MRHAFTILEELGPECDRLGVRVVDVHGSAGPASEFFAKLVSYIEAREAECDRLRLTDDERTAIAWIANNDPKDGFVRRTWLTFKATLCGLLERTK